MLLDAVVLARLAVFQRQDQLAVCEFDLIHKVVGFPEGGEIDGRDRSLWHELERKDVDRIWAKDDIVIITTVGAGMRGMPGVAARVCGALADHGINIEVIAQGSSEYSISLVVESADAVKAVQVLHNLVAEVVRQ